MPLCDQLLTDREDSRPIFVQICIDLLAQLVSARRALLRLIPPVERYRALDVHFFRNSIGRDAGQNRRQTRLVRAGLPEKKGHAETFSFHLFKLFSMRHIGRLKSPEYWMQNNAVQCFTTIHVVHFFVRGPCTTLWHTERLRRNTPRCGDEKRKQSRISLIYRIVCLPLRRSAAQKRRPIRPPMSGKRDSDPRPQPWQGCALPTELFPQNVICYPVRGFLRVQR